MEQPRRRLALIGAGALLLTLVVVLATRRPAGREADHAFPIPGEGERLIVEVLNGSGRAGLARTATRVLRRGGLDVILFGNADATTTTRLLVRRGDSAAARRAGRLLGAGAIEWDPDSTRRVDVTVILGADYQPPSEWHP